MDSFHLLPGGTPMRAISQGPGATPRVAVTTPDALPAEHEILRVSIAREEVLRHPADPPRAPSGAAAEAAAVARDVADEELVADPRAGVTPAEMVELNLRSLLRGGGVSADRSGTTPPGRGPLARKCVSSPAGRFAAQSPPAGDFVPT
jgi:hypothetical protein